MRSGTVPHVLAVGLGAACEISQQEMEVCLLQTCVSLDLSKSGLLITNRFSVFFAESEYVFAIL